MGTVCWPETPTAPGAVLPAALSATTSLIRPPGEPPTLPACPLKELQGAHQTLSTLTLFLGLGPTEPESFLCMQGGCVDREPEPCLGCHLSSQSPVLVRVIPEPWADHTLLSFRPWVQDVEGANAKHLCSASSPKGRTGEPGREGAVGLWIRKLSCLWSQLQSLPFPLLVSTDKKPCQRVFFRPHAMNTLSCPLLSRRATRRWLHDGQPLNASASCLVLPSGDLLLAGTPQMPGPFQCWALEAGFEQLVASYCPQVMPAADEDEVVQGNGIGPDIITSRVSAPAAGGPSRRGAAKSYWTEFLVMCALFAVAMVLLLLFLLYRHRGNMKLFLKQGDCASMHPKGRPIALPPETRPLNGLGPPSIPLDHRGYQALSDSSPGPRVFTESEKRPLSIHESFVEVSPVCPRPRVRLGSEIRDSVV